MESAGRLFEQGGPVMYGIAAVSMIAFFLIAGTWLEIRRLSRRDREPEGGEGIARLDQALALISALGVVLPLLGLLGTVLGMLKTFAVIQVYGTGDPRLLAGGIRQALLTTQAGLVTALPVLIFCGHLRSRAARLGAVRST